LVEDFLPERLDFDLAVDADRVEPAEPFAVIVDARFLYGAPASNLTVAGLASLIAVRELDAFPGYLFGLADEETSPTRIAFNEQTTDEDGRARLDVTLPKTALMTRPQQAVITTQVFDTGGRPVERSQTLAVTDTYNRLGLKARFDSPVTENSSAGFDVIAVDPATERVDLATADWVLSRVETEFQWFRSNGRWNYRPLHRKRRIATGTVTMTAGQSGRIDVEVAWGAYELSVAAGAGVLPVSHRFEAGWRAAASAIETPEMLQLTLDKSSYAVGDTVAVQITAPFAGRGEVLVVDNRLIERVSVDVTTAGATVDLLVTEDWGPGAYVLASVYRPMNLTAKRMPARAMGLAWASVDPGDRVIAMSLATPETARPRQSLPVTITLPDHAADREIYLTLAAVDAGILNLTGHQPPDPRGWYFGQRRLGVSIRDFYNQLIDRMIGSAGVVRSGGDASIMSFDGPPPPETLMAFHSGVVPVDSDGRVTIDVPVPDFSGTVRLMAMAWSAAGVGHAVMDVVVRDPVVVTTSMPRFLAPGDRSRVLIDIDNVEKLSGEARLIVSTTGDGGLSVPAVDAIRTVRLDGAGRSRHLVPITAHFTGMTGLSVELELPDGSVLARTQPVEVRNNEPPVVLTSEFELAPGARLSLDRSLVDGFLPDGWSATLSVSGAGRLDVAGIVRSLDLYPYGCSEQITSRALPLIYLDEVVAAAGLSGQGGVRARVDDAIATLIARQSASGGFGLWSAGSGDLWLDAYVTDFLSRAVQEGYSVPEIPLRLALDNLKNQLAYVPDFTSGGEAVAYGLYVLARHGEAAIGDLRYYANARLANLATPMAKAQIGAALGFYGDMIEADNFLQVALADFDIDGGSGNRLDFGSRTRDGAAVLTLASEAGASAADLARMTEFVAAQWSEPTRLSTQEQAWSLLAANALMRGSGRPNLSFNGERHEGALFTKMSADDLIDGVHLQNHGREPVYVAVSRRGVADAPEPAGGDFANIERLYFTLDGVPVDPATTAQGDRLVAVLSVLFQDDEGGRLIVDDPLPAGFEIDNPNILRSGEVAALDWLSLETRTEMTEFRSDRFVVAFDRRSGDPARVNFAYIVRAVSPGSFAHPAAIIEDMYRPERRARTASGTVQVVGALR
ncbi:MAG: alpha-2-macroglobulin family protein, partial [Alphaproteobacteria bacterium]